MKRMIKGAVLLAAICLTTSGLMAQTGLKLSLNYNVSTPLGTDFKNYINSTSTRGGQGSVMYGFNNGLRAGLQVSVSNYYQKFGRQVYDYGNGTKVSAVLSNTLQTIPILAKGEYSFLKSGAVRPFAGLGAGINLINFEQYVGEFNYTKNYTAAAFSGDAGVLISPLPNKDVALRLSTSYLLQPFNKEGIKNLNAWNVQAGIVLPLNK
jgi:hypothetical protein